MEINEEKGKGPYVIRLKDGYANVNFKEAFSHPSGTISRKL
jgi:hypothetical protein